MRKSERVEDWIAAELRTVRFYLGEIVNDVFVYFNTHKAGQVITSTLVILSVHIVELPQGKLGHDLRQNQITKQAAQIQS